jgi:cation:H+ antiporter
MLPLVYAISGGHPGAMHLDGRQCEEIFLTAAQSLLAVVILANWSFGFWEAVLLFGLFVTQLVVTATWARTAYAVGYLVISVGYLCRPAYRRSFLDLLARGWRTPPPAASP